MISRYLTMSCDAPLCDVELQVSTNDVDELYASAYVEDWARVSEKGAVPRDYCPVHWKVQYGES